MKWIDVEKTANDLLSGLDTSNKILFHFVSTENKEKKKIENKKEIREKRATRWSGIYRYTYKIIY
jgi:hypothetical protein